MKFIMNLIQYNFNVETGSTFYGKKRKDYVLLFLLIMPIACFCLLP